VTTADVSSTAKRRLHVAAAAEERCPRCGAPRAADQEYCVECGLRLPVTTGLLPSLRRTWLRRLGWYPGDWIWVSLVTFLVAVAGAATAIVVTRHERAVAGRTVVAPTSPGIVVRTPTVAPATTASPADMSTLPTAPEANPTPAATAASGWPAQRNGWTIVLASYPSQADEAAVLQTARKARRAGLPRVGVLDSSTYPSLQPGYLVVFSGVYGSQQAAETAVATVHGAGFSGAYVRQVAG
jgi:hypothetical protein